MNKEDILEKSRQENQNNDPFEKEVLRQAAADCNITVVILSTLFFIIHILSGHGMNYGLYAVLMSGWAATYWTRFVRMRKRHEGALAAIDTIPALILSAAYIYQMLTGASA